MEIVCTPCSKRKRRDPGLIPAKRRYLSKRIRHVLDQAERTGQPAFILSGRYGLLGPDEQIPWYDRELAVDDLDTFVPLLARQLRSRQANSVIFYARPRSTAGWGPYHEALEQACRSAKVQCTIELLDASFV